MEHHEESDEAAILKRSTRYWLTRHAREAAAKRAIPVREALLAATAPQESYSQWYRGANREFRVRGETAVVVDTSNGAIITVLWNREERWTDEQAVNRGCAA